MSFDWVSTVPLVKNGETTLDENGINPSIQALTDRTNALKQRLDNLSGTCGLVYTDIGFDSSVGGLGTLIAWDSQLKKYIPAAAAWKDYEARDNGSLVPADSSYVTGILVSEIDATGSAVILANGWTSEPSVISAVTGDNPIPGQYYLNLDGKAVHAAAGGLKLDLPVYCFTLTASGKLIFNPKAPEQYGHSHGKYDLASWEPVESGEAPEGMTYKHTPEAGEFLGTALLNYPKSCLLIKNGSILTDDDWTVSDGKVFVKFMPQTQDQIALYITTPTFGYQPLVHSVSVPKGTELLTAVNDSGNVTLNVNTEPLSTTTVTGEAIVRITEKGMESGPVVQNLYAGPGVDITAAIDADGNTIPGGWQVGATYDIYTQRDLQVCNLDGVLFGIDDTKVSYKFPADVSAALYGTFRTPNFDSAATYTAVLNVAVTGCADGYTDLDVTVTPINASPEGGIRIPGIDASIPCSSLGRDAGKDYLVSAELPGLLVKPNQLLLCRVHCNNGAYPLTVLGISLSLR